MADEREPKSQRMQALLAELTGLLSVMNDVAQEESIDAVPFLGGYIQFGLAHGHHENNYRDWVIDSITPFAKGPKPVEYPWSSSTFDCWPTDEQREWAFGDDRTNWRKTTYEEDD